jgi:HAD superfamily hydrolase (TIGR01509 family)
MSSRLRAAQLAHQLDVGLGEDGADRGAQPNSAGCGVTRTIRQDDRVTSGLAAVLFDMDGTLVDSESLWGIALHELAKSYGGALSDAARLAMVGTSSAQTMQIMLADLGQLWRDPVAGARWLDDRVEMLFAKGLPWRPGAQQLLSTVRAAGLPTGLVTNTNRRLTEVALLTLGARNFEVVVTGDDVTRNKPHPMPYLTAAAALGVDPACCVAIEDSTSGVASALAAGCAVIAIPNETPLDGRAHLTLASLHDVDLHLLRGHPALVNSTCAEAAGT